MPGRGEWVAELVERIEHADQVVAAVGDREGVGFGDCEGETIAVVDASLASSAPSGVHRTCMVVETSDLRGGERLREQDRGRPVAAADVGDAPALGEAIAHTVQRRDPVIDEVAAVGGLEHRLGGTEDAVVVLAPRQSTVGSQRVLELRLRRPDGGHLVETGTHVHRAVLVGEHHGVLQREFVGVVVRVVLDVAAGRLVGEPFGEESLVGASAVGEIRRRDRAGAGHRPVQAETAADVGECARHGGAEVADDGADELLDALRCGLDVGVGDRCHVVIVPNRPVVGLSSTCRLPMSDVPDGPRLAHPSRRSSSGNRPYEAFSTGTGPAGDASHGAAGCAVRLECGEWVRSEVGVGGTREELDIRAGHCEGDGDVAVADRQIPR